MPTGRMSGNITQDWEPVVLRRAKPKAADLKSAKAVNQAELAKRINERAQVVQEYESGKAVPVQAVLAKMERALEVKLRGKAVGAPAPAGTK
ncbi:unnamed protein product [Triticum turgidum subsp. durum]|uniref:HTH cro/C1-type domain-containing protein n=1 Tax=Triticum turgidum subsp. durum TaxID=4567 RepID=A0A9R1C255_TRITD|nr:unnamed protein product [Triticum turgidum subsp. durum]